MSLPFARVQRELVKSSTPVEENKPAGTVDAGSGIESDTLHTEVAVAGQAIRVDDPLAMAVLGTLRQGTMQWEVTRTEQLNYFLSLLHNLKYVF